MNIGHGYWIVSRKVLGMLIYGNGKRFLSEAPTTTTTTTTSVLLVLVRELKCFWMLDRLK